MGVWAKEELRFVLMFDLPHPLCGSRRAAMDGEASCSSFFEVYFREKVMDDTEGRPIEVHAWCQEHGDFCLLWLVRG